MHFFVDMGGSFLRGAGVSLRFLFGDDAATEADFVFGVEDYGLAGGGFFDFFLKDDFVFFAVELGF